MDRDVGEILQIARGIVCAVCIDCVKEHRILIAIESSILRETHVGQESILNVRPQFLGHGYARERRFEPALSLVGVIECLIESTRRVESDVVHHGDPIAAARRVADPFGRGVHGTLVEPANVDHVISDIKVDVEARDQTLVKEPADQGVILLAVLGGEAEDSVEVHIRKAELTIDNTEAERVCTLLGAIQVDKTGHIRH